MDSSEGNCEICFVALDFVVLSCRHRLCSQCMYLGVLPKEICPFCKQKVTTVTVDGQVRSITSFEKPIHKSDFFEESNFELINADFFLEDLRVLRENIQRTQQHMMRTIRQVDSRFNQKWQIFESLEFEIDSLPQNSIEAYQKILEINTCLIQIQQNNWDSQNLAPYIEVQAAPIENQFVIHQKKRKNKKR